MSNERCVNCDKPLDQHFSDGPNPHVWCERRLGSLMKWKPETMPTLFEAMKRSTGYEL